MDDKKIESSQEDIKILCSACGKEFQGGAVCEQACCNKQHEYCKFWEGEVRGYLKCMDLRNCYSEANYILHGRVEDEAGSVSEGNQCNYMNKNFGIECLLDESCEQDQLCATANQGGAQCEKDCCKKQHQYCWNGNLAMWGYFKCMRVRGCGNVLACNDDGSKAVITINCTSGTEICAIFFRA